jgi:hypothetical protein
VFHETGVRVQKKKSVFWDLVVTELPKAVAAFLTRAVQLVYPEDGGSKQKAVH